MDRKIVVRNRQSAQGFLKWAVVDAKTKEVIRDSGDGWIPNLILNNGMNSVYTRFWADCFTNAVAGTGTTPTSVDSGATNASQSGTTITADGSFFASGDVGNVVKFDSGEEALITAFVGATQVTVSNSATVGSGPFVMYNTNQTGLAGELKRTQTYLTGTPNCQTTSATGQIQMRRTYDFTAEVGTVNYTEIGFAWATGGANTTFSRILLPSLVQVLSGQQLRVVYELRVSYAPLTPQPVSAIINGWPLSPATDTDGDQCIAAIGLAQVNTNGSTTALDNATYANEPCFTNQSGAFFTTLYGFLTNSSAAVTDAAASAPDRTGSAGASKQIMTKAAYVTDSFYVDKSCAWPVGEGNRADFRSMGYGISGTNVEPYQANRYGHVLLFDQAQTKPNTHTLTLTWRTTWSRTLS
jgi:hypothetical protein